MSPSIMQSTSASANAAATGSATTAASPTAPVTENMFLQLLVTQLQNQDPSNPADSTQFVSQLAQFQTMEQSMTQGENISSILTDMNQMVAALPASGTAPATGTTASPTT
jgi:flagellar basal-body rod modification protein FlgD